MSYLVLEEKDPCIVFWSNRSDSGAKFFLKFLFISEI